MIVMKCIVQLYHTKNCQGATTNRFQRISTALLYHTKNCQGATTALAQTPYGNALYHTKNCQGATTEILLALHAF